MRRRVIYAAMPGAQILSVQVGKPRVVDGANGPVLTSIFKSPVEGSVAVRRHNLDGDQQSDLTVHGGPHKAVYLYPSEHYAYWRAELPDASLEHGNFGENLTTAGLDENTVVIGDRFRFGSAVLQVTQPRMPCYKLGIRFGWQGILRKFWESGRSGIYFSVVEEGALAAGDAIEKIASGPEPVTVADVVRLFTGRERDPVLTASALRAPLFGGWKRGIEERRAEA